MLRLLWFSAVATAIVTACYDCDVCDTAMCNRVAKKLSDRLSYEVRPCDDFRKYTCPSRNGRDGSRGSIADGFSQLNSMENNDVAVFRDILSERFSEDVKIKSLEIERKIFKSCKNNGGVRSDKDKLKYLKTLPEKAKILETLHLQQDEKNEHWVSSDRDFAIKGYGFAFFNLKIIDTSSDPVRSRGRYIQISPPTDNILEINSLFARKYDSQGGSSYQSNNARELKNFLNDLNAIIQRHGGKTYDETLNLTEFYSVSEWNRKWAEKGRGYNTAKIDWEKTMKYLFTAHGMSDSFIKSNFEFVVKEESYFLNDLTDLLIKNRVTTIENYINLRYISKTIGLVDINYLDYSMIPSINQFDCVPGLFVGTAYAYAKKHFPKDNRNKLEEVFEEVRKNIVERLSEAKPNDEPTRAFVQKLSNAKVMYGYPEWLLDENLVSNLYPEKMNVNDEYFINEEAVYGSVLRHNLKAFRNYSQPIIDINQFFKAFTSTKIEIFEKNANEIVLPVRVFSETNLHFFSSLLYDPMNYASAGAILATEIYQKWLDTAVNTNNVTDCMGKYVPSSLAQKHTDPFARRATSYLLGLRTAYEAWPNKDSYPIMFPMVGAFYDSRLFFLSFAETLCDGRENDQTNSSEAPIDPITFMNSVLSNMKEFQETFVCEDRQRMTRKYKCDPLNENEIDA